MIEVYLVWANGAKKSKHSLIIFEFARIIRPRYVPRNIIIGSQRHMLVVVVDVCRPTHRLIELFCGVVFVVPGIL